MPASVVFVSTDLMFAGQAGAMVRGLGAEFVMAAQLDQLTEKLTSETRLVVFDAGTPGLEPAELVTRIRAAQPQAAIVAYGAHVQHERLEAARVAGCTEVFTRGQFHAGIKDILARHLQ